MNLQVAPSILDCDLLRLGAELEALQSAGADWIHLDVMDGHFVPNLSFGVPILRRVRAAVSIPIDSHLMVQEPEQMIPWFLAESHQVVFHLEATTRPAACLDLIQAAGRRAGIALRPDTPVTRVTEFLPRLDAVLVMSVYPGFGGQQFMPETISRIAELRALARETKPELKIWVDGGIGPGNCAALAQAGADVIVAGSAICRSSNYAETIRRLRCSKS